MTERILIVDDEPLILTQMSKGLCQICGFHGEINTVKNGKEAIDEICRYFYKICFLDIGLPDINGLEVMKMINRMSPETKVVIMSAAYITEEMKKKIKEGASMFIEKPFDFDHIKTFMKQNLLGPSFHRGERMYGDLSVIGDK